MRRAAVWASVAAAALAGVPPGVAAARESPAAATGVSPRAPTRAEAWIARLVAETPAWPEPKAEGSPRMLEPLGKATGGPVGLLVLEVRDDWLRVLLPSRPNGDSA